MGAVKKYKDHLGNEFSSKKEMCKYHGVNVKTFGSRINRGYSVGEALTKETVEQKRGFSCGLHLKGFAYDHLGNKFLSVESMCKHYEVDNAFYYKRLKRTNSVKYALTGEMD